MVTQYPHTITLSLKAEPAQSEDGTLTAGAELEPLTIRCRAEANGSGKKIAGTDGTLTDYTWDIFAPRQTAEIPEGTPYLLNGAITGTVKRAINNQFNTRIWL